MPVEKFANRFATTLSAAVADTTGTSISVANAAVTALQDGQFRVRVGDELMLVTATGAAGASPWTVTRGVEGSTATTHASGVAVTHVLTSGSLEEATRPALSRVVLAVDVANDTTTLADVTGLAFPMDANARYAFRFFILFKTAVATTGSRWGWTGPAGVVRAVGVIRWTTAQGTVQFWTQVDYQVNVNASVSSVFLPSGAFGNVCVMEGTVTNGPTAGDLIARFASEVAASAITVGAGSYVEYRTVV